MNRRKFLLSSLASTAVFKLPTLTVSATNPILKRPIPSSGELIPSVGMGTWITFDVGTHPSNLLHHTQILEQFFAHGGGMIDSSPMYGTAQKVLGKCFTQMNAPKSLFSATKVWTPGKWLGIQQMEASEKLWGLNNFDLLQVHNLLDWQSHLQTLHDWQDSKRVRYTGVTTSHGRRHDELTKIMQTEKIDFVQFTYNITNIHAEEVLLPLAAEKGIAVIINRPFDGGRLFNKVKDKTLPEWAIEFGCHNWAQYFLKYILSHPAVTVAIPATSQIEHMNENMGALIGELPNAIMRNKMRSHFLTL